MKTYTVLSRRDLIALIAMCDANRNPQQTNRLADTVIVRGEAATSDHLKSDSGEQLHQLKVPFQYYVETPLTRPTLPGKTDVAPVAQPVTRLTLPGRHRIDASTMDVRPSPAA